MNILYLSAHSVLEYDELLLFHELGFDFFSLGSYINPRTPHDPKRPPIDHDYNHQLGNIAMVHNAYNLHDEQVAWADVVIAMHIPDFIIKNWETFKRHNKRVIWRSIGQSVGHIEEQLKPYREQGMEIVRYSPAEARIPGYIGEDAIIRFYKDPDEFKGWTGETEEILTFSQDMKNRGDHCHYDIFQDVAARLPIKAYGPHNENLGEHNGGVLSYDEMKEKLRTARVFFYTGTVPASYTLSFMEAWMTGIPIVALGAKGNSSMYNQNTYEVDSLIKNGLHGFVSDDIDQIETYITQLVKDKKFAAQIGKQGREEAIRLFDKELIKKQWRDYLV